MKAFQVQICDDEQRCVEQLRRVIERYLKEKNITYEVNAETSPKTFLANYKEADIVFLDIEMGELSGLEVAERIRRVDVDVPIIYVTGYDKYYRRAYKVHAFDYISKPFGQDEVCQVLDDVLRVQEKRNGNRITFTGLDGEIVVPEGELVYLMVSGKRELIIRTCEKEFRVRGNLADMQKILDSGDFFMCHRTCMINLRFVEKIENEYDILTTTGDFCPLAQRKRKEFLEAIGQFGLRGLKEQQDD